MRAQQADRVVDPARVVRPMPKRMLVRELLADADRAQPWLPSRRVHAGRLTAMF